MRCLWIHVGAFGELRAALPFINAICQRYPELNTTITSTNPECQGATFFGKRRFLKVLFSLWKQKPVLLISYTFMVETRILIACLLLRIPVVYIYEGFCGIRSLIGEPYHPGRQKLLALIALWRVTGVVSQPEKHQELVALGCPVKQIVTLKNLKLI
ncbi:MAG: glycosyltransferase N-terminal domain-containing protein [Myxococcaceae bacterium]